ncbi:MAG: serine--tRNA ligase [Planctomycetes bacterium]|nr:serine--tRNA ligase [Planctomycetota bacterium]
MLDIKFIRQNPEQVREACRRKRIHVDLDKVLALDAVCRESKTSFDSLKGEQNRRSKELGKVAPTERAAALDGLKQLSQDVKQAEAQLSEAEASLRTLLLLVPNVLDPLVPEGRDDSENKELKRVGSPREFGFKPRDHVELGVGLDILDIERATRIAGSRTYYLKNEGVLLEMAVLRFALERMMDKGFTPMSVPHLVRSEAMEGTAYLPGGEEQAYRTQGDDMWLIGTSEVPVTAYRMGEILNHAELPLKMAGISPCYRREAGTYGKDTRGLYRIHQFQKVEQVIVCRADEGESKRWHEVILANAEELLQAMELPYRVVDVCDGDLGRPQVRKFDIETWMPSRNGYGETHSASRFHEYQARRLELRYRDEEGKVRYCHTLNNTVIASPRILIPLLENHQQEDGSVVIPLALRPFMGGRERITPRG